MNELITQATQKANELEMKIHQACMAAAKVDQPEGQTPAGLALWQYLMECLDAARKLETKLNNIAP